MVTAETNSAKPGESCGSTEFIALTVCGEMGAGTVFGMDGQSFKLIRFLLSHLLPYRGGGGGATEGDLGSRDTLFF